MISKLQWDSNFWGTDIYSVDNVVGGEFSNAYPSYPLIQYLIPCHDVKQIKIANSEGFEFVQGKVTLEKNNNYKCNIDSTNFKPLTMKDLDSKGDMFYDLYSNNCRYKMFPRKRINDYYYTWLKNSIAGQLDDECIGYYIENEFAGFVSYKKSSDNTLVIGLIGVFPQFHRRGISQKLLNYVDYYAYQNNCHSILVATQDSNKSAINAYIKYGYNIHSIEYWYYKISF